MDARSGPVLKLEGSTNTWRLAAWDDAIRHAAEDGRRLILLDMRGVADFDEEGLRWLAGLRRFLADRGTDMVIAFGREALASPNILTAVRRDLDMSRPGRLVRFPHAC